MERIKKYLRFDFLFPIGMVYLWMPVMDWIIRWADQKEIYVARYETFFFLSALFLSVWWILLYYDGKVKTAAAWWVRTMVMILPVWITYYCIYMNRDDAYVLLEYLVVTVLGNMISGSAAFVLRKISGGSSIVFILMFMWCLLWVGQAGI